MKDTDFEFLEVEMKAKSGLHLPTTMMRVNGLRAELNTPAALKGDAVHGLPPHDQRCAYVVDEYPACPTNWMHGSDIASSYFVPVKPGRGMWFDFTQNANHAHHVAVVISVQGVNPITGQKMMELNLQQYKKKCPVHDVNFKQDRYCPECKFKWSAQNYIATTTGQTLWLDGFRNEEGVVRQYIITEEECRSIAGQVIGEDRVFAIGFAFYLSREAKPAPTRSAYRLGTDLHLKSLVGVDLSSDAGVNMSFDNMSFNSVKFVSAGAAGANDYEDDLCDDNGFVIGTTKDGGLEQEVKTSGGGLAFSKRARSVTKAAKKKKLEIGAGAQIDQGIGVDPNEMEFWSEEPVGMIYINYVTDEVAAEIMDAGKREDSAEGFMEKLKVGNE